MELISFVPESLYIVAAAIWFIGHLLKKTDLIKDELIPFILMIISVVFVVFMQDFTANSILQGIMCTAVAVLGNNIIKQSNKLINSQDQ